MALIKEYSQYDALELARLVRSRQVSASELVDTAVHHLQELNPLLNSVIHPQYEKAKREASLPLPDGPFKGVPFLMKDLGGMQKGEPYSAGSRALSRYVAQSDSPLFTAYRNTGLVNLGRTNTSEFGIYPFTEPKAFGPARNPWGIDFITGGSSGGAAAAVAAGLVPMAAGSDGGGSIRIPAGACGLFGLKPSRGRIPGCNNLWQGAMTEHILTRSVRDSAAMLDATKEPDGQVYLDLLERPMRKLRIAFTTESPLGLSVDPVCIEAVKHAVSLLQQSGHHVEEASPRYDGMMMAKAYMMMTFRETASMLETVEKLTERPLRKKQVEGLTLLLGRLGRVYSNDDYAASKKVWQALADRMEWFHARYDLLVTPVLAIAPPKVGTLRPRLWQELLMRSICQLRLEKWLRSSLLLEELIATSFGKIPFTQVANLTGQPAMSVPLYQTGEGLPVGVQLIAGAAREDLLLQTARQLEIAAPWIERRPVLFAH